MAGRQIPWPRIFAEGVAIVVSILLAFGIQAWWEGQAAIDREKSLVQTLVTELGAASDDLQQYRDHHAEVAAAASELISLRGEARVSPAKADSLLGLIVIGRPYSPSEAVLGSLLGADGVVRLSDSEAAVELARWRQATSNLAAQSDIVAYHLTNELNAYVNREIPYRTLDLAAGSAAGFEPSRFPTNVLDRLESVEFENVVYNRHFLAARVAERVEEVLLLTHDLLARLRGEWPGG